MAGRRLAVALGVAAVLSGCGGDEVYFELDVVVDTSCTPLPQLDSWMLELRQDNVPMCVRGPCGPPTNQPFDCVAGMETLEVEPGQALDVTFGVYDVAGNLVACEFLHRDNGVEEGDRLVLMMHCAGFPFSQCPDRPPVMCPMQQP